VTTARIKPGVTTQDGARVWEEQVAPLIKQARGVRSVYAMGNPDTRQALTVVVYESKADADAFAQSPVRGQMLSLFKDVIEDDVSVQEYEVVWDMTN
jgi:hypothetical protein